MSLKRRKLPSKWMETVEEPFLTIRMRDRELMVTT